MAGKMFLSLLLFLTINLLTVNSVVGSRRASLRRLEADLERDWEEFKEFKEWQKWKNNFEQRKSLSEGNEESFETFDKLKKQKNQWPYRKMSRADHDSVLMARYVVNQADWTSVATVSTRADIKSYPFSSLISMTDGHLGNGSGVPYIFLTPFDDTAKDLARDHRTSLLMSLAQGSWCTNRSLDQMDPRCARVTMTGKIKELAKSDSEYQNIKSIFFSRHPRLNHVPDDHKFFFAKLKIASISLFDAFGGAKHIDVNEYLGASVEDFPIERFNTEEETNYLDSSETLDNSQSLNEI